MTLQQLIGLARTTTDEEFFRDKTVRQIYYRGSQEKDWTSPPLIPNAAEAVEQLRERVSAAVNEDVRKTDYAVARVAPKHRQWTPYSWLAIDATLRERFCVYAKVLGAIE